MKTIITGVGGLVGGVLSRRLAALGDEVLALRRADLDVTDAGADACLVGVERPSLVVNCAVLGVDERERYPEAARAVNVEAPRALARVVAGAGAAFLHFSTNYVFDGEGDRFYAEEDEPRPSSVYGRTKADGERAALDANARTMVVRTSWVFGVGKRSFLSTAHGETRAGRRVRAIKDTWASVTYVEDLASRVEELLALDARGLFHVVNEGVCTYDSSRARPRASPASTKARPLLSLRRSRKRRLGGPRRARATRPCAASPPNGSASRLCATGARRSPNTSGTRHTERPTMNGKTEAGRPAEGSPASCCYSGVRPSAFESCFGLVDEPSAARRLARAALSASSARRPRRGSTPGRAASSELTLTTSARAGAALRRQ